jgi:hypothetical protein
LSQLLSPVGNFVAPPGSLQGLPFAPARAVGDWLTAGTPKQGHFAKFSSYLPPGPAGILAMRYEKQALNPMNLLNRFFGVRPAKSPAQATTPVKAAPATPAQAASPRMKIDPAKIREQHGFADKPASMEAIVNERVELEKAVRNNRFHALPEEWQQIRARAAQLDEAERALLAAGQKKIQMPDLAKMERDAINADLRAERLANRNTPARMRSDYANWTAGAQKPDTAFPRTPAETGYGQQGRQIPVQDNIWKMNLPSGVEHDIHVGSLPQVRMSGMDGPARAAQAAKEASMQVSFYRPLGPAGYLATLSRQKLAMAHEHPELRLRDATQTRRKLSPEEEEAFARGKERWLPEILQAGDTELPNLMADPLRQGVLGAAAGGALPLLLSATHPGMAGLALPGAALGGLGLALHRYLRNRDIHERAKRLPPGARKYDLDRTDAPPPLSALTGLSFPSLKAAQKQAFDIGAIGTAIKDHWNSMTPAARYATIGGLGTLGYSLFNKATDIGPDLGAIGPILGGGLAAAGLASPFLGFKNQPEAPAAAAPAALPAPGKAPPSAAAAGGLTLQQAAAHPQFKKFFANGQPNIQALVGAPDHELRQAVQQLHPHARNMLKQQLMSFQPSAMQRMGARLSGIDIDQQRQRFASLLN